MASNQPWTTDDPGHCWLCGELRVETNLAAIGEPACRVCGCRIREKRDPESLARTKQQIRGLVGEIQELVQGNLPPSEVAPAFLMRVTQALAAYGAILWRAPKKRSWFTRPQPMIENEVGYSSYAGGPEFAAKVMREKLAQVIPGQVRQSDCLLIGVPIFDGQGVCGAIEIVQRPGAETATQRGYLLFAKQMVELVPDANRLFA
jgi:hypothetical protein